MAKPTFADPVKTLFASLNRTAVIKRRSDQLSATTEGVRLVREEVSNLFAIFDSKISEIRGELPLPIPEPAGPQPGLFIMVYGPVIREANAQRTLTLRFDIQKLYSNSVVATTLEQSIYFENTDTFGHFLNIGLIEKISYSPAFVEDDRVVWLDKDRAPHESAQVISEALKAFGRYIQDVLNGRQPPWQSM